LFWQANYEVDRAVPFLSEAERHAINQVVTLGAAYAEIIAYVDGGSSQHLYHDRKAPAAQAGPRAVDGLYNRALKAGLEEQLDEYRRVVIELEAELLSDPSRPLSHLRFRLHTHNFHLTLPALSGLVATVSRRGTVHGVAGAQLLELLHESAACAAQPVATSMHRVSRHCHAVLYNQCAAWTLHGRLLDPQNEFFVSRGGANRDSAATEDAAPWDAWASGAWDTAPWDRSAVVDGALYGGHSHGDEAEATTDAEAEWHQAFLLRIDAVPLSYFSSSLAHQILFVGKATRALKRGAHVTHPCSGDGDQGDEEGVSEGRALSTVEVSEFSAAFERLKGAEIFHLLSFEALIRSLHAAVAGRLWDLVVVRAKLCDHLQAVRDLVLLGKGELWHELVLQGQDLMRQPPNYRSEDALRDGPLAAAKRQCGLEVEGSQAGRLHVSLALESFVARHFDASLAGFVLKGGALLDKGAKAVVLAPLQDGVAVSRGGEGANERQHWSGAVASVGAKKVRRSFSSLCKVSWSAGSGNDSARALSGGAVRIGFVLTGSSGVGGASGARVAGDAGLHKTSERASYGLDGGNGVGVYIEFDATGAHISVKGCSSGLAQPSEGLGSYEGAAPPSASVLTLAQAPLLRRPLPDTGHWLLVEYDLTADATLPMLRVFFDDPHKKAPPVLETSLALHKALTLDSSDAAFISIHAAVTADNRNSDCRIERTTALLPAVSAVVHDWTFTAHKTSTLSPTGSSNSKSATALERSLDVAECWDELVASYAVTWPLSLVLTSDASGVLGKIFTTLLWPVKRVCVDLEHLWPHLMDAKYRQLPKGNEIWLRPLQTLHGRMLFFVRNLQVYLQVDVVEVQHQTLLASVRAHQHDFDAVRRAYAHFLASLLAKSHVNVRPLVDGLKRLLRLCRHFTNLVLSYSNAADIPHAEVAALAERFQTDASYLFLMLDRTDAKELSARLDYNGWHFATAAALTGAS